MSTGIDGHGIGGVSVNVSYVLAASAVAASHTGDTAETALATVTIPANAMGPNGRVRITTQWSFTNSANNKTLRVRFGGPSGTVYASNIQTTTASVRDQREIANRGVANSQVGGASNTNTSFAQTSGAVVTSSVNTAAATTVVLSGQLASSGETITLESYLVEIIRGP